MADAAPLVSSVRNKTGVDSVALEDRVQAGKILRAVAYLCGAERAGINHGQVARHSVLPCRRAASTGAAAKNLLRGLRDGHAGHIGGQVGGEQMRSHRVRKVGLRKGRELGICEGH